MRRIIYHLLTLSRSVSGFFLVGFLMFGHFIMIQHNKETVSLNMEIKKTLVLGNSKVPSFFRALTKLVLYASF